MTVFVVLTRCPDCGSLTFDPRDGRCSAACCYCDDESEPDFQGCVASGCQKDACREWRAAEDLGEERRERWTE